MQDYFIREIINRIISKYQIDVSHIFSNSQAFSKLKPKKINNKFIADLIVYYPFSDQGKFDNLTQDQKSLVEIEVEEAFSNADIRLRTIIYKKYKDLTDLPKFEYIGNTLRAFLSYKTDDKIIAGEIKSSLQSYGFDVFLAHEDIQISQEWEDEIIRHLQDTDIFIPLLSENFYNSEWTEQECGIAFALSKKIVPITLDHINMPKGFIAKYQADVCDLSNIGIISETIFNLLIEDEKYSEKVSDTLIKTMDSVDSYSSADVKTQHLNKLKILNKGSVNSYV